MVARPWLLLKQRQCFPALPQHLQKQAMPLESQWRQTLRQAINSSSSSSRVPLQISMGMLQKSHGQVRSRKGLPSGGASRQLSRQWR